jgi:hypothetical protein
MFGFVRVVIHSRGLNAQAIAFEFHQNTALITGQLPQLAA